jgi:transcription elongation factor Elf1
MDEKQKADYLRKPYHCPHCNSGHIEAETFEGETSCQPVVCLACGEKWLDIYTLTDVKPLEPNSP